MESKRGASAVFPRLPPPHLMASKQASDDLHLQSTQALSGYPIQTSEGAIGHVIDFIMDDKSWAICHLVVETGHWYSRKEIVISPKHIDRISYEESKVFVNVSKEAIMDAPQHHVSPLRRDIWRYPEFRLMNYNAISGNASRLRRSYSACCPIFFVILVPNLHPACQIAPRVNQSVVVGVRLVRRRLIFM